MDSQDATSRQRWGHPPDLGRFREVRPESRLNLFQDFWMAKGLNAGDPLTWGGLLRTGARRLLGRGVPA